jgi:hypothetical protein
VLALPAVLRSRLLEGAFRFRSSIAPVDSTYGFSRNPRIGSESTKFDQTRYMSATSTAE